MKYNIIRTDTVDADIRKIIHYVAQNFGNDVALEKLDEIENSIFHLSDDSYAGVQPIYPVLKKLHKTTLSLQKYLLT